MKLAGEAPLQDCHIKANILHFDGPMRIQVYIIAFLLSAIMWGVTFDAARNAYRAAHTAGLMPNLHIQHKIDRIL
ncbi:hypothetical protein FHX15_001091 [Rhizobium sp. BK650]|uniref:hypothetical protein n=1 Tax=Rhizobium sp. BK650 TaxID=2586990 RepID=UPI00160D74F7|nr:hypothetical protein [Rhizobium sp. BK650]MBB3655878.1 hypothetical protein [Rhizobium sp. BK650]